MESVLIIIHLLVVLALIAVVLLQRSEGGALGIGGGGGGGFMSGRGAANALTRMTAGLAVAFFATSIVLTIMARGQGEGGSIIDRVVIPETGGAPGTPAGPGNVQDLLEQFRAPAPEGAAPVPAAPAGPAVPQSQ